MDNYTFGDIRENFSNLARKVFFDSDTLAGIGIKSNGHREIKEPIYTFDPFGFRRLIKLMGTYITNG